MRTSNGVIVGKPISGAGARQQSPVQSPVQSAPQSPEQAGPSPVKSEPKSFWPPAYGWRLKALGGEAGAQNAWKARWLEHGSAIAGGGPVDSVAALKTKLHPHLKHGAHKA